MPPSLLSSAGAEVVPHTGSRSFFKQSRPVFPAGSCASGACHPNQVGAPHITSKDSGWPASTLADVRAGSPSKRPSSLLSPGLPTGPDIFLPTQISSFAGGPLGRKAWLLPLEPELNLITSGLEDTGPPL